MKTKNLGALAGLTMIATGMAISGARAQSPRTIYLYNASLGTAPAGVLGAQTAPWGNGEIKPTRRPVEYEGASVLELTTRNFAEGARFDLKTPVDIAPYREKGFIRLRLKFADDRSAGGRFGGRGGGDFGRGGDDGGFGRGGDDDGGFGRGGDDDGGRGRGRFREQGGFGLTPRTRVNAQFGAPGALPQFGERGGGFQGGGFDGRGGFQGGDDGGDGGFGGRFGGPPPQKTEISQLRVTLVRETGTLVGRIPIDLEKTTPDEGGWRLFVLPISDLKETPGGSGLVKRMVLTSDVEDTFFMAQAALVIETGKMEVSIRPPGSPEGAQLAEITVKPGAVTLIADVEAGAADPQVEWNFDADSVGNFGFPAAGGFPGGGGDDFRGGGRGDFGRGGFDPRGGGFDPRGGGFDPRGGGGDPRGGGFDPRGGGFDPRGGGGFEITGPRVDARGLTATFTYPNEEQNYRVEVKVTDKSGKKEPVTASILVKVRG